MAYRTNHGGGCCGITHIRDFLYFVDNDIQSLNSNIPSKGVTNHLYEVVLTEHQVRQKPALLAALKAKQFRLVSQFRNKNSGNICYVFHRCKQTRTVLEGWEN
jgi:hypothetical protein